MDAGIRKVYGKKYDWWVLTEPAYMIVNGRKVVVPAGYETDFASAPRLVPDWLIPRAGLSAMPSAAHDYLCEHAIVSRAEADLYFLRLLLRSGVPRWQAWLMFAYVRALGWVRYGKS